MCLCGFFSASFGLLSQKIISETSEYLRSKYFGRLMFYQAIGCQIALLISGITSNYLSNCEYNYWFYPFGSSSILCFLFLIYITIFLKCDTIKLNNNSNFQLKLIFSNIKISVSWISVMIVAPFVGLVSDIFHQISPSRGRSVSFQFGQELVQCHPILSEIVLPSYRATVFALSSMFEGIGTAFFGTRLVGDLAVFVFGYHLSPSNVENEDIPDSLHNKYLKENSKALGNAILCMTVILWTISIALFNFTKKKEIRERSDSKVCPQLTIINSQLDYLLGRV
ncbi:uncharacterized protein CMU_014430 [Cryptosporidium muris RN66]|uniref:Uncharacterized protein n=1 Tax=Cryptosporidium muris (strain RN66) TaxID=441375 RepID=B6AF00_CRYMR|nr:uncharacterized protein CMU_014430 [Cryptosporidium muris RN66]EEA06767.1 hypothetical protein, conserved [Cryptosporidium muris RN66]|eukprot:XP_002141116.1 hypothetical protein [Cryptosporidium muris RN66]